MISVSKKTYKILIAFIMPVSLAFSIAFAADGDGQDSLNVLDPDRTILQYPSHRTDALPSHALPTVRLRALRAGVPGIRHLSHS